MDNDALKPVPGNAAAALLDPPATPEAPPAPEEESPRDLAPYVLSVAIPAYNEKDTLRELLARVRAVNVPMEILIVDDGSTDGTREILRDEIEGRYDNVRVFYHDANQGKGAAILTAIRHATGDFLIVQDADLEYDPSEYKQLLP